MDDSPNIAQPCELGIFLGCYRYYIITYVFYIAGSSGKVMGYSTFRHFLKDQFPNVRFHKDDMKTTGESSRGSNSCPINNSVIQNR